MTEHSHSLRILLAEDSPTNQRLALGILSKWGHRVVVANNGREALERLRDQSFDVVFMDIQMPEMGRHRGIPIHSTSRAKSSPRPTG